MHIDNDFRKKGFRLIRKFEGLTANDLIEILKNYPRDIKVCTQMLGENFPVKQVEECIYCEFKDGKRIQEHKGILIK
jgi:hypothetical protein